MTNGRKGDAPRREYCASTATRPSRRRGFGRRCGDAREFACRVLGGVMNALMDSEAQQMCGAGRNERSDGRENSRNGYRPRSLKTAVGDVELEIPKLRHGTYTPRGMLARWSRVDTSVAAIVQEMYVCGVSTRKVERVASKLAYPRCRARRSEPLLRPRRRGGGVPQPRPVGHAVLLPVARTPPT
ncbi:MAG: transposase [Collinsella aerofaciens]